MSYYYAILYDKNGKRRYRVQCAAFLTYGQAMVYFEFVSRALQPVNAIRANIYKNRRTRSLVATEVKIFDEHGNAETVRVIPKTKYHFINHRNHYIFFSEGFDKLHMRFLLGGDEENKSPFFTYAMQQFVQVPFLSGWADELWIEGIKAELITRLAGVGATAWKLNKKSEAWIELVQHLRTEGGLMVDGHDLDQEAMAEGVMAQIRTIIDDLDYWGDPIPVPLIQSSANGSHKFDLGTVYATPKSLETILNQNENPSTYLTRHHSGDWGDMEPQDMKANDRALVDGSRIFSSYQLTEEDKVWLITEADRTRTTLLLPSEY
jgi:hypothetical protein